MDDFREQRFYFLPTDTTSILHFINEESFTEKLSQIGSILCSPVGAKSTYAYKHLSSSCLVDHNTTSNTKHTIQQIFLSRLSRVIVLVRVVLKRMLLLVNDVSNI